MKLSLSLMGFILIILCIVLLVKRYSVDDFILTGAGIILLVVGIVWKNTGMKKVVPASGTSKGLGSLFAGDFYVFDTSSCSLSVCSNNRRVFIQRSKSGLEPLFIMMDFVGTDAMVL